MDITFLDLQHEVLNKLAGKFNLIQYDEEKETLILWALSEACGNLESKLLLDKIKALSTPDERKQFVKNFLSYGVIEDLLKDPDTEDIIINSLNPIYIHTSSKGLVKTDKQFKSQRELDIFIRKLVVFSGRANLKKINNLELPNIEGRVNIVSSPLGPQITITKAKEDPLSIIDLIEKGTLTYEMAAQLWLYLEGLSVRPANIIVAGGPGSGKTTVLNALISFIPASERLVVIEDTLELNTRLEDNYARLESDDDMSMADLVKNALRMRPDRIIVGEVRGQEAQDLMTAMNIGKYCLGTLHASTAREAILRLQSEPMNIPETLVNLINVFVLMRKFHIKNDVFRVVNEIVETAGLEQRKVLLSELWRYNSATRKFIETSPSCVYRDYLASISDLSGRKIIEEVFARGRFLRALADKGRHTIKEVSVFCRAYNTNPKQAMDEIGL